MCSLFLQWFYTNLNVAPMHIMVSFCSYLSWEASPLTTTISMTDTCTCNGNAINNAGTAITQNVCHFRCFLRDNFAEKKMLFWESESKTIHTSPESYAAVISRRCQSCSCYIPAQPPYCRLVIRELSYQPVIKPRLLWLVLTTIHSAHQ